MRYLVQGGDGSRVEVEAVDWMMAMAQAIAELGIEVSGWACQTRPDGSVVVVDPMTGSWWELEQTGEGEREDNPVIEGRTVAPVVPDDAYDLVAETVPPPDVVAPSAPSPVSATPRLAPDATPRPVSRRGTPAPTVAEFSSTDDFTDDLDLDAAYGAPEPPPRKVSVSELASVEAPAPPADGAAATVALPDAGDAADRAPSPPAPASEAPPEPRPEPILQPRPRTRPADRPRFKRGDRAQRPNKRPSSGPDGGHPQRAPSTGPDPSGQSVPAASAHLRAPTTTEEAAPEDLAERLFDLTMELSDATDGHDACRRALDLCLQLVPCEAGSVLRGGLNDAHLTFVAVAGPAAGQLIGQRLPFGKGIVGASFDLGITIGVDDVADDPRHASDFDRETGFRTRSVLCVPVQGREQYHGAIQLLNPVSGRFVTWHRDTVEQLAASLASVLDATVA